MRPHTDIFKPTDLRQLHTGRSKHRYRFDYEEADHVELLELLKGVRCQVMVSGYRSALYEERLAGWRSVELQVMMRAGAVANTSPTPPAQAASGAPSSTSCSRRSCVTPTHKSSTARAATPRPGLASPSRCLDHCNTAQASRPMSCTCSSRRCSRSPARASGCSPSMHASAVAKTSPTPPASATSGAPLSTSCSRRSCVTPTHKSSTVRAATPRPAHASPTRCPDPCSTAPASRPTS